MQHLSTEHIPTSLAQHLQVPAKRSQHFNATYRDFVGRNMLRAFGHPVAMKCWVLKTEKVRMPGRITVAMTWPNDYNIMQHPQKLHENLAIFKFEPTTPNMLQHVTTRWPNTCDMLRLIMSC